MFNDAKLTYINLSYILGLNILLVSTCEPHVCTDKICFEVSNFCVASIHYPCPPNI